MAKRSLISVTRWLATIVLLAGIVMAVRNFCMESFRVSTDSMEVALHKGDYILVNKLPIKDNPGRNRVVLFTSPLLKDTVSEPLFLSRCIGMPGDTIRISNDGYRVNGKLIPHSPRSLSTYIVTQDALDEVLGIQKKLNIPLRNLKEEPFGISFSLTSFEEYQLREELSEDANIRFLRNSMESYELIVPQKGRAYRLDAAALTACREAIQAEAGDKAVFCDGKLFLDGREAAFFFFDQDYYWMLSDNANEAVDSRHLGFIPRDHIVGNAWLCWYSKERQRILKPVN